MCVWGGEQRATSGTMPLQASASHCIEDIQLVFHFRSSFVLNVKAAGADTNNRRVYRRVWDD